jgi:four helix bundle protein
MAEKKFDLEERTLRFSKDCIDLCKLLMRDNINIELISQLVRSSGSVGANYREANDSITKKDFYHRIGICRREAKESKYWLELLLHANQKLNDRIEKLIDEALQLARIFASISKSND